MNYFRNCKKTFFVVLHSTVDWKSERNCFLNCSLRALSLQHFKFKRGSGYLNGEGNTFYSLTKWPVRAMTVIQNLRNHGFGTTSCYYFSNTWDTNQVI